MNGIAYVPALYEKCNNIVRVCTFFLMRTDFDTHANDFSSVVMARGQGIIRVVVVVWPCS